MIYVVLLLIFLFTLTFLNGLLLLVFNKERPIDKLKYCEEGFVYKEKIEIGKKKRSGILKTLSKLVPRISIGEKRNKKTEQLLIKADIPITVEELFVIKVLSSTIMTFLAFSIQQDRFICLSIFVVVWSIPKLIINNKKTKRLREFNMQIKEGIIIISNSLKAGYSFLQAVAVVAKETKDPFSKEFKRLLKEMSLGISTEDALKNMLERIDSEDLRLIVNAILIQKDIGGNLSEILDNISETIMERQKIQAELKTLTAQGKLSGVIVGLIPIALGLAIYMFNKEYIMLLFNTSIGIFMISTAVISQAIGFIIIRKIIKIEM